MYVSDFIENVDLTTNDFEPVFNEDAVGEYLSHHGTKNMKWGQRRYQNADGSLTPLGRLHYGVGVAGKAAGSTANKVGSAIKRKINPSVSDLEKKYAKEQEKQRKRELKNAIRETKQKGKKKSIEQMSAEEATEELNRLKKQQALKDYKKEISTARKIGKGAQAAVRTTAEGARLTAKGAAFTAKTAGKIASPLFKLGGDLAMRGLRNAGENWIDDLTASNYTKAKNKADIAKNMLNAAKDEYDVMRFNSGEYQKAQRLKDKAENAKNAASIAESRKKIDEINNPEKKASDFVKEAQARRDIAQAARDYERASLERDALNGNKRALKFIRNYNLASRGKKPGKQGNGNS